MAAAAAWLMAGVLEDEPVGGNEEVEGPSRPHEARQLLDQG